MSGAAWRRLKYSVCCETKWIARPDGPSALQREWSDGGVWSQAAEKCMPPARAQGPASDQARKPIVQLPGFRAQSREPAAAPVRHLSDPPLFALRLTSATPVLDRHRHPPRSPSAKSPFEEVLNGPRCRRPNCRQECRTLGRQPCPGDGCCPITHRSPPLTSSRVRRPDPLRPTPIDQNRIDESTQPPSLGRFGLCISSPPVSSIPNIF